MPKGIYPRKKATRRATAPVTSAIPHEGNGTAAVQYDVSKELRDRDQKIESLLQFQDTLVELLTPEQMQKAIKSIGRTL